MRKALDRNEFCLHYQPQVELETGRIFGVEALLRWEHPELGLLYPDKFISLAEETGLIIPLGEWVVRAASVQNKTWQQNGFSPIQVAVNISAQQFKQRNFAHIIGGILDDTGLDPEFLELEITETITMQDSEYTFQTLKKIKEMKNLITIDDFGTGYCSLTYLRKYPIDKLKIDKSFIQDITDPEDDNVIVKAIITMARNLNLTVIAEGVESPGQIDFLRKYKCHGVQGFLFGRPMPAVEITRLLER